MRFIGLDIGGANIKAADNDGQSVSLQFEIWKYPERLSNVLTELLAQFPSCDRLAVTMTAELADCFETKAEGVDHILTAIEIVANEVPIEVWQTGGEFVSPDVAREIPLLVAAANWHAQATWIARMVPRDGALLIDIGTTTTDIIPMWNGTPVAVGLTDSERLASGELVYTGVRRTPLCAVASSVPFGEGDCALAAELFATTLDVYLLLDKIGEDAGDCLTANGRSATKRAAHDRLARMLCCDRTEVSRDDARAIAQHLAARQRAQIERAIEQVLKRQQAPPSHVLVSGSGSFLGREIVAQFEPLQDAEVVELETILGLQLSEAACAYAVARLAADRAIPAGL